MKKTFYEWKRLVGDKNFIDLGSIPVDIMVAWEEERCKLLSLIMKVNTELAETKKDIQDIISEQFEGSKPIHYK